jgi:hypothetical protein
MSRSRRGVGAHGEAGPRHGSSTARARAGGAHARARVLVFQSRGVAVPCAEHRRPGPAARRGGEGATAVAGQRAARRAPARKKRHGGRREGKSYGLLLGVHRRPQGTRRQHRGRKRVAAVVLTGGAEGGTRLVRWRVEAGGSVRCRKSRSAGEDVRGAGSVKLRCGGVLLLAQLRAASSSGLLSSFSSSPFTSPRVRRRKGKRGLGRLGFRAKRPWGFMGRP